MADKEDFFYADDSLVASTNPVRLQWVFDFLIHRFNRVGIKTNVEKIVAIVRYRI